MTECRHCGASQKHFHYGYGFGGVVFGGYTICMKCDRQLEVFPDMEGMKREQLESLIYQLARHLLDTRFHGRDMIAEDIGI